MTLAIQRLHPTVQLPRFAHPDDAGLDLYLPEPLILKPGERKTVALGFAMALPKGTVGLIWDKSSRAAKWGVKTMGGVIDAGYRGEVKTIVLNSATDRVELAAGEPIAQLLIQPVLAPDVTEVVSLDETARGVGGFGSTHVSTSS
ncbi:MAG: dUTP diphosphatase [Patescibacteria group bacterium]|jgi:dUTP pyrophosphatase